MLARGLRVTAAAVALLLLLTACALIGGPPDAPSSPTPEPGRTPAAIAKSLQPFYKQTVEWKECGQFGCASIQVPMDYADPEGERVTIALKRRAAGNPGTRIGSLLINPGGPGGSGVGFVDAVGQTFSRDLLDVYDVVGFDPRGVGDSTPIECVSDAELDELRAKVYDTGTPAGLAEMRADAQWFAAACSASTGRLLEFVDTVSAARDMDIIRELLGDERLHYLGYSYGTFLGATYADLFPGRVGRMVLDGGMDPTLDYGGLILGQAAGFELALRQYVADCLATRACPLRGDVDDAVAQVRRFLDLLEGSPLETASDRQLTQSLALSGIFLPLYEDRLWPLLTEALGAAMREGDGSQLLFLADIVAEREDDGSYSSNGSVAINAINCVDIPADTDAAAMDALAARLERVSPTFGTFLGYGEIFCEEWPVPAKGTREALDAPGAAPILVVGTTRDPATPYEWSEALADQLESARLLTYRGDGHTAYGRSNSCVADAVDRYLIEGVMPEDGLVC